MKVAVVAETRREAREIIARLGMVGKAEPIVAEESLSGLYFTAVIVVGYPELDLKGRWWEDLQRRSEAAPFWRLENL